MKGLFFSLSKIKSDRLCLCWEKRSELTEGRGQEHGKDRHNLYSVLKVTLAGISQSVEWLGKRLEWGAQFTCRQWKDFLFTKESRLGPGYTKPRSRKMPAALYHGVKRQVCEVGHSLSSDAEIGNTWSCTSISLVLPHWGTNTGWGRSRIGCWERYMGLREKRSEGLREDYITRVFVICSPLQILLESSNREHWDGSLMWYVWGGKDRCTQGFGGGDPRERNHLENLGVEGGIILKWALEKWEGKAWTGLIWFRTGTGCRLLWMQCETSGSIKCGEFLD